MPHVKHLLFPRTINAQVADLNSKRNYLKANAGRFGISNADMAAIDTQVNILIADHVKASDRDTRSKIDVAIRNKDIITAQTTVRTIIGYYILNNPKTTDVDREALNIPRSGPHKHLPDPTTVPGIGHIISNNLAAIIPFFDALTGKHGKPEGVQSIEARYKLGGEPPESPSDMIENKNDTDSPMRIQFDFDSNRQILYLVFRWVGTRGNYGPWSEIYQVVIVR
jgi:hypothetical protein